MKQNQKWKIPHTVLERRTLCFSSYKNHKLKLKLWWVGAHKRKKTASFVPFILSEGNFCNICILSQCIAYWVHFQNLHTFTYQNTLLHTLLLLVFKIVESLHCILDFVKKTSMLNPVKSIEYIVCSSSPRPAESPSNSLRYNCQKIYSWLRRLEIRKKDTIL